jgi:hypothetical protein
MRQGQRCAWLDLEVRADERTARGWRTLTGSSDPAPAERWYRPAMKAPAGGPTMKVRDARRACRRPKSRRRFPQQHRGALYGPPGLVRCRSQEPHPQRSLPPPRSAPHRRPFQWTREPPQLAVGGAMGAGASGGRAGGAGAVVSQGTMARQVFMPHGGRFFPSGPHIHSGRCNAIAAATRVTGDA